MFKRTTRPSKRSAGYLLDQLEPRVLLSGQPLFFTVQPEDGSAGSVAEYSEGGGVINASLITGLTDPHGLAVSGSHLFVTNNNNTQGSLSASTTRTARS
jgi:hypothetical protein